MDRVGTLIVARDRLFRDGFAHLVEGYCAVAGTTSLEQALEEVERGLRPRLLIVDAAAVHFAALQRIRSQLHAVKIVILLDSDTALPFAMPAECDIDGYILKDISPETLERSLGLILDGHAVMPRGFASAMFRDRTPAVPVDERRFLTARESEVLQFLCRGLSNKGIARELDISAQTVKVHLKTLLRKLQVRNRTEAAVWAMTRPAASTEAHRLGMSGREAAEVRATPQWAFDA
jgi:two-component system nitrate/nitrite response regulator NarL